MSENFFIDGLLFLVATFLGLLADALIHKYKIDKKWTYVFCAPAVTIIIVSVIYIVKNANDWQSWVSIAAGTSYIYLVYRLLNSDGLSPSSKLIPKVIAFTKTVKQVELKLFAGDLNFLGNTPDEMENNGQYIQLKQKRFDKILILCEKPTNNPTKMRIGKMLKDFPGVVEFRFYDGRRCPDLKIRGRIAKKHPNLDVMIIYERIEGNAHSKYRTIEGDNNNADCDLYVRIWAMLWNNAENISAQEKLEYDSVYNTF